MTTATDTISKIVEREAAKLERLSNKEPPLNSEQLEALEMLSKIVKQLQPSFHVTRASSGMSEEEALRIVEGHDK